MWNPRLLPPRGKTLLSPSSLWPPPPQSLLGPRGLTAWVGSSASGRSASSGLGPGCPLFSPLWPWADLLYTVGAWQPP